VAIGLFLRYFRPFIYCNEYSDCEYVRFVDDTIWRDPGRVAELTLIAPKRALRGQGRSRSGRVALCRKLLVSAYGFVSIHDIPIRNATFFRVLGSPQHDLIH